MDKLIELLENPGKEYRAMPLWSWNDRLESDELKRQIREMDKAGLGGYFIHARDGLKTEYLGDEWFDLVKLSIDEGIMLGMQSWGYDEYGFPSGHAGGSVTGLGDAYHARDLEIRELEGNEAPALNDGLLGFYSFDVKTREIERLDSGSKPFGTNKDVKLFMLVNRSVPIYIDILNKKVVRAFIDATHEKYYKKLQSDLGKGMPGFFTDETSYRGRIPWSYILPEAFMERNGYDLLEFLPALFIECKGYEKIRYDFWGTVNHLFVDAFGKQIYNWCEEHGCKFTGHYHREESIADQMTGNAGVMPFYEYMHIPGIDWLGRGIDKPVLPKQASSVANQMGRKFVLSESFALTGWGVSFEEMKWMLEWQFVNGVNMISQHVAAYTLRGRRKRDFPLQTSYQDPWWEDYRFFADYFARLSFLLAEGRRTARVLLLHPVKSAWITFDGSYNEGTLKISGEFDALTEALMGMHIEHDYGDETIISKYGRVDQNRFIVGECSYDVVIMPAMINIDKRTLELLNTFLDNDGKVISIGSFPTLCEGVEACELSVLRGRVLKLSLDGLHESMEKLGLCSISIAKDGSEVSEIHYCERDWNGRRLLFMVNLSRTEAFSTVVSLKGEGRIWRLDMVIPEMAEMEQVIDDGIIRFQLNFLPMQSYVVLLETVTAGTDRAGVRDAQVSKVCTEISPGDIWNIEKVDLNSLTLDYCDYRVDGGEWKYSVPVICLMDEIMPLKRKCEVEMRFNFTLEADNKTLNEFYLVLENPENYSIEMNAEPVIYKDKGWWRDMCFKKVNIRPYVRKGSNTIILKYDFKQPPEAYKEYERPYYFQELHNDTEPESIYLLGDFSVFSKAGYTYENNNSVLTDGPFVIRDAARSVKSGDLTEQGFCFFSGSITLSQIINIKKNPGEKIIWKIKNQHAPISKVYMNGRLVKSLAWAPYEADVTDYADDGENRISIELISGNRNLFGPHHHVLGELHSVYPGSFWKKKSWGDFELNGDKWLDRYCFISFGIN